MYTIHNNFTQMHLSPFIFIVIIIIIITNERRIAMKRKNG